MTGKFSGPLTGTGQLRSRGRSYCLLSRNGPVKRSPVQVAPGYRNNGTGVLTLVGNEGTVWSGTADSGSTNAWRLVFTCTNMNPENANNRSYGFQVRCLQGFAAPCFGDMQGVFSGVPATLKGTGRAKVNSAAYWFFSED